MPVHTDYKDVFNILNTTAAIAACTELGLPLEGCCQAASSFVALKQRYDEFQVGGRRAVMILSKNQNPVSFDQSITHVLEREGEKTVVVLSITSITPATKIPPGFTISVLNGCWAKWTQSSAPDPGRMILQCG